MRREAEVLVLEKPIRTKDRVKPGPGPGPGSAAQARPLLSIGTLGKFTIRCGDREIVLANRKSRALIGYLALSDSAEESRERLVGLLWSESEEEKARASLRQSLYEVREALLAAGFAGLNADKLAVALDRAQVEVDLARVIAAARDGQVHELLLASERPIEGLLRDFETVDPAFRSWLLAKRQFFHDQIIRRLEPGLRDGGADRPRRAAVAQALLNLDPTHEEAARAIIHARASDGDIGGALRVYKGLWDLLAEEYDVEPSEQTQALIAQVKLAQPLTGDEGRPQSGTVIPPRIEAPLTPALRPAPAPRTDAPPKLVVSVGAFDAANAREDRSYFVQGFRRELIACLVRFREWVVRDLGVAASGPPPAQRQPQSQIPPAEYVIEASAIEGAEAVRLVLTLREAASSDYLWSERLQFSMENWFDVQQLVVRRLATALNVHLSAERLASVAQRPASDLKAYDMWLLGQATFLSFDPKNWDRATDLFHRVVAQMPAFAPAHSSLAQLHNSKHIVMPGVMREMRLTEQALAHAREAARLDPIDSRSQLCLGWSHAMAKQYDHAMIYIPLALELNENDPWTMVSAACCFAYCAELDRAHEIAARALALPLAPSPFQWSYHVTIRFMEADYEGCLAAVQAAGDINLNGLGCKVASLHHLGRPEEARLEMQRFFDIARDRWVGAEPASDENITRWLLQMFPIKRPEDWARLRDGVAAAGAPVRDLAHHAW